MGKITYSGVQDVTAAELADFYRRLQHEIAARPEQIEQMISNSQAFVVARDDGRLIGLARGLCDGVRGYLTECKLDPAYQGPAAVTRTDGRIEHDQAGIAAQMAQRVLAALADLGAQRIDALAWGTEVDFCEELGFRRQGGLVGLTMPASACQSWAHEVPAG
ncbi:MAG: GNAT family N-acetyltransferase [Planctomycetota bacterium]|nr:MAG: GNAT family N-acetyltransferase [Planctomycetota bacterium]